VLFMVALSFLVAGLNVRYRDTQHVVEVALLAGFWVNPIVYSVSLVRHALEPHGLFWAYFLNPMAGVVVAMQRAIYVDNPTVVSGPVLADDGYAFYLEKLGLGALVSAVLLVLGVWTYRRMSADFAEEL
jgi:ABC-2 type transport system permease protein